MDLRKRAVSAGGRTPASTSSSLRPPLRPSTAITPGSRLPPATPKSFGVAFGVTLPSTSCSTPSSSRPSTAKLRTDGFSFACDAVGDDIQGAVSLLNSMKTQYRTNPLRPVTCPTPVHDSPNRKLVRAQSAMSVRTRRPISAEPGSSNLVTGPFLLKSDSKQRLPMVGSVGSLPTKKTRKPLDENDDDSTEIDEDDGRVYKDKYLATYAEEAEKEGVDIDQETDVFGTKPDGDQGEEEEEEDDDDEDDEDAMSASGGAGRDGGEQSEKGGEEGLFGGSFAAEGVLKPRKPAKKMISNRAKRFEEFYTNIDLFREMLGLDSDSDEEGEEDITGKKQKEKMGTKGGLDVRKTIGRGMSINATSFNRFSGSDGKQLDLVLNMLKRLSDGSITAKDVHGPTVKDGVMVAPPPMTEEERRQELMASRVEALLSQNEALVKLMRNSQKKMQKTYSEKQALVAGIRKANAAVAEIQQQFEISKMVLKKDYETLEEQRRRIERASEIMKMKNNRAQIELLNLQTEIYRMQEEKKRERETLLIERRRVRVLERSIMGRFDFDGDAFSHQYCLQDGNIDIDPAISVVGGDLTFPSMARIQSGTRPTAGLVVSEPRVLALSLVRTESQKAMQPIASMHSFRGSPKARATIRPISVDATIQCDLMGSEMDGDDMAETMGSTAGIGGKSKSESRHLARGVTYALKEDFWERVLRMDLAGQAKALQQMCSQIDNEAGVYRNRTTRYTALTATAQMLIAQRMEPGSSGLEEALQKLRTEMLQELEVETKEDIGDDQNAEDLMDGAGLRDFAANDDLWPEEDPNSIVTGGLPQVPGLGSLRSIPLQSPSNRLATRRTGGGGGGISGFQSFRKKKLEGPLRTVRHVPSSSSPDNLPTASPLMPISSMLSSVATDTPQPAPSMPSGAEPNGQTQNEQQQGGGEAEGAVERLESFPRMESFASTAGHGSPRTGDELIPPLATVTAPVQAVIRRKAGAREYIIMFHSQIFKIPEAELNSLREMTSATIYRDVIRTFVTGYLEEIRRAQWFYEDAMKNMWSLATNIIPTGASVENSRHEMFRSIRRMLQRTPTTLRLMLQPVLIFVRAVLRCDKEIEHSRQRAKEQQQTQTDIELCPDQPTLEQLKREEFIRRSLRKDAYSQTAPTDIEAEARSVEYRAFKAKQLLDRTRMDVMESQIRSRIVRAEIDSREELILNWTAEGSKLPKLQVKVTPRFSQGINFTRPGSAGGAVTPRTASHMQQEENLAVLRQAAGNLTIQPVSSTHGSPNPSPHRVPLASNLPAFIATVDSQTEHEGGSPRHGEGTPSSPRPHGSPRENAKDSGLSASPKHGGPSPRSGGASGRKRVSSAKRSARSGVSPAPSPGGSPRGDSPRIPLTPKGATASAAGGGAGGAASPKAGGKAAKGKPGVASPAPKAEKPDVEVAHKFSQTVPDVAHKAIQYGPQLHDQSTQCKQTKLTDQTTQIELTTNVAESQTEHCVVMDGGSQVTPRPPTPTPRLPDPPAKTDVSVQTDQQWILPPSHLTTSRTPSPDGGLTLTAATSPMAPPLEASARKIKPGPIKLPREPIVYHLDNRPPSTRAIEMANAAANADPFIDPGRTKFPSRLLSPALGAGTGPDPAPLGAYAPPASYAGYASSHAGTIDTLTTATTDSYLGGSDGELPLSPFTPGSTLYTNPPSLIDGPPLKKERMAYRALQGRVIELLQEREMREHSVRVLAELLRRRRQTQYIVCSTLADVVDHNLLLRGYSIPATAYTGRRSSSPGQAPHSRESSPDPMLRVTGFSPSKDGASGSETATSTKAAPPRALKRGVSPKPNAKFSFPKGFSPLYKLAPTPKSAPLHRPPTTTPKPVPQLHLRDDPKEWYGNSKDIIGVDPILQALESDRLLQFTVLNKLNEIISQGLLDGSVSIKQHFPNLYAAAHLE